MHALVDSDETFLVPDPIRKIRTEPYTPGRHALATGFGTSWSGLAAAWLTEWERHGPRAEKAEARLLSTMETIAAQPNGFVQGEGLYNSGGYVEAATSWVTAELEGPDVLVPGGEAKWVSTNTTALYGLAVIQNLALIGDKIPD